MAYKFKTQHSPDLLMLTDLTETVFEVIGKPLEPKGIFLLEQLPDAIEKLERAIKMGADAQIEESGRSSPNRFIQRYQPFLTLLKTALSHGDTVVWGV